MTDDTTEPTFRDHVGTVPVGEKYAEADLPDGRTVREGDVIAFDDPDVDERDYDRGVHSRAFVGYVEALLDPERRDSVEVFATTATGRLDAADCEFSGEGARIDPQTGLDKFAEQLLTDDAARALTLEWGEDIDGSGEDFKGKTE